MQVADHPEIRKAERYGMEEAEQIGTCEQCGAEIYAGYEHGIYQGTAMFCCDSCFHDWIGYEVVDSL